MAILAQFAHFPLREGFRAELGCAVALEKATFDLTLQHLVRLAGSAPGINIPVYFALVAELDGQRTFEPYTNFLDKGTDLISIALSYPCH